MVNIPYKWLIMLEVIKMSNGGYCALKMVNWVGWML